MAAFVSPRVINTTKCYNIHHTLTFSVTPSSAHLCLVARTLCSSRRAVAAAASSGVILASAAEVLCAGGLLSSPRIGAHTEDAHIHSS